MTKMAPTSAAQLILFELEDRSQSHLIALYDLAPRFVFVSRDNDKERPPRTRASWSPRTTSSNRCGASSLSVAATIA